MQTMTPGRRNRLLTQIASLFKAVPQRDLDDLADALDFDARPGADAWNSDLAHRNPDQAESPTGSPQSASGSGAVRMVGECADTTGQSGLVQQYEEMAAEMETMRTRMADLEKAPSATATAFAAMLGMSRDAAAIKASDEDAPGPVERTSDDEDADEDEDADVKKGRIRTVSIADMMGRIAGRARQAAVSPPHFGVVKSQVQGADALLASGELSTEAANDVMTLRQRMHASRWAYHCAAGVPRSGLPAA